MRDDTLIGIDSILERLEKYAVYLRHYPTFEEQRIPVPHGILFSGPKGTGKTSAANHLAKKAGAAMATVYDFKKTDEKWTPGGVDAVFDGAAKKITEEKKPLVLLVEDFETIGRARTNLPMEETEVVTQLTLRMDGMHQHFPYGLLVVGTTTNPANIDQAFLRKDRFDDRIDFSAPDYAGKVELLQYYLSLVPYEDGMAVGELAALIKDDMPASDIKGLVSRAHFLAKVNSIGNGDMKITSRNIVDLIVESHLGPPSNVTLSEAEKLKIAIHESGHAIVGRMLDIPVRIVCVQPSGYKRGVTIAVNISNLSESYGQLRNYIAYDLAGKAADEMLHDSPDKPGNYPIGHESDIVEAARKAYVLVERYGFSKVSPSFAFDSFRRYRASSSTPGLSEKLIESTEGEMNEIVRDEGQNARKILEGVGKTNIIEIAELIARREYVLGSELDEELRKRKVRK